mmetsp:Transcript_176928/g.567427  ORF Transcript_176928/g.567427 Transcript_176928/m.567427 type:complete len:370 (-) Transcript_176928:38-1147(-)
MGVEQTTVVGQRPEPFIQKPACSCGFPRSSWALVQQTSAGMRTAAWPSSADDLQAQGEILATNFEMLAPVHAQGDLVHGPLGEVADKGPLPNWAHEEVELEARALAATVELQPHCTVDRRTHVRVPRLCACGLAAALTGSPSLAWQKVHAQIGASTDLQGRRDKGESTAAGLELGENILDTPLCARRFATGLLLGRGMHPHAHSNQLLWRVRQPRRGPEGGEEHAGRRRLCQARRRRKSSTRWRATERIEPRRQRGARTRRVRATDFRNEAFEALRKLALELAKLLLQEGREQRPLPICHCRGRGCGAGFEWGDRDLHRQFGGVHCQSIHRHHHVVLLLSTQRRNGAPKYLADARKDAQMYCKSGFKPA